MMNIAKRLLTEIQGLAPVIRSRAAEIEASRRVPPDLVEARRSLVVFGVFVPQSDGGLGLDLPAALEILRGVFLPARDWQIEDTWYVAGLKGTGSHHIALRDAIAPAANFFDLANGRPCLPGPLYQAVLQFLPLMHGASSLGMAEGALDELAELAKTGRKQLQAALPMKDSETFQAELGRIEAELRAGRALLELQAASHWRHALAGTL